MVNDYLKIISEDISEVKERLSRIEGRLDEKDKSAVNNITLISAFIGAIAGLIGSKLG